MAAPSPRSAFDHPELARRLASLTATLAGIAIRVEDRWREEHAPAIDPTDRPEPTDPADPNAA